MYSLSFLSERRNVTPANFWHERMDRCRRKVKTRTSSFSHSFFFSPIEQFEIRHHWKKFWASLWKTCCETKANIFSFEICKLSSCMRTIKKQMIDRRRIISKHLSIYRTEYLFFVDGRQRSHRTKSSTWRLTYLWLDRVQRWRWVYRMHR